MRYLVSAEEMKRYDSNTIEKIGVPALVLMERAALQSLERMQDHLRKNNHLEENPFKKISVLILAGFGNNGGDGLALGRLLAEEGAEVELWCVGDEEKATEQWKHQRRILNHYPIKFSSKPQKKEYTIVADALFGVGLSREITGIFRDALECFNSLKGWKLALDMPSGVDTDNGSIWGIAAKVDETVTFEFCKRGLVLFPGCEYAGEVTAVPIGISEKSFFGQEPEWFTYDEKIADLLPAREQAGNKGTFGKVLLIAGSENMAGAAVLAAKAAYRAGAGMVKVISAAENRVILQQSVPEALLGTGQDLTADLKSWADVVVIGPGLGKTERACRFLKQVVENSELPLVVDADGLNLLAEDAELRKELERQGAKGRQIVLTPHVGELARLAEKMLPEVKKNLYNEGKGLAEELHAVVAAKEARTLVCREKGSTFVNLTGNSGMATAGSGDVLAGIIGGLAAQGMSGFEAAALGVFIHGKAGDRAAETIGEHGCMAGDIVTHIGKENNPDISNPDTGRIR